MDKDFVAATIQAIGRCATNIGEVRDTCLNGLVQLLSNRDGESLCALCSVYDKQMCIFLYAFLYFICILYQIHYNAKVLKGTSKKKGKHSDKNINIKKIETQKCNKTIQKYRNFKQLHQEYFNM